MSSNRILLTTMLALSVLLTAASNVMTQQDGSLREEFHQTYPLSSDGRVSLENINGSVQVRTWDRDEVKVDAVKSAYRRDRLDEAKIEVHTDANSIRIETQYQNSPLNSMNGSGREQNPATVEYTLTVPRRARLDSIELINGNLEIEGVAGDVKASSINGRVTTRGLLGSTRLSTVNGNLEAVFDRLSESNAISLGSVNGNVTLTIPSNSNAELKAGTIHGAIINDYGLPVRRGDYIGNDLAGQLGEGGARIKLGNVNGSIAIRHAQDGRPLSRATSLMAEKIKDKDKDQDQDEDLEKARTETRRAAREAARQAARSQIEVRRAQAELTRAQVEAQKARRAVEAENSRSLTVEQRQALVEAQRAQTDALRAQREALAEAARAQVEVQRAQVEAQRIQVEGGREARRAIARVRVEAQSAARTVSRADIAEVRAETSLRLVERESKTFQVDARPSINVRTFDGNITVRGWDKQEVQLTISKRASAEQQLRGIRVRADQNGSTINIGADFDQSFTRKVAGVSFINALVSFELYVPRGSMVQLNSGDGRLELEGVNGTLELNTADGRIEVHDAGGNLTAKTGDGRIEVENFNGVVNAATGDGRINLEGRFEQLTAKTGGGSIVLALPSDFNATIVTDAEAVENEGLTLTEESGSSKRLKRWRIGQGGKVLTLHTGEGRIILRRAER